MSMADRDGVIWLDGEMVPWREAKIHVLTHTLHYGMGVFEGVRAYNAEKGPAIFRLEEHTDRLFRSAHILGMPMPYDREVLNQAQIRLIAGIQLRHLSKRLEGHGFNFVVSDEALDLLGEAGFDPVYGARPLKRAIQNEIENPLAQKILSGGYAAGDTVQVDVEDGRFTFD